MKGLYPVFLFLLTLLPDQKETEVRIRQMQ